MKNFAHIVFLLLVLTLATQAKLYQIISLFRHGARYHVNTIYDGNSTISLQGELSSVGMRQQQNLGKIIRKQYIEKVKLLSDQYNSSQIQIYSTRYNRTIQSAISHLYGLYPLGTGPKMPYADRKYHLPPYTNKTDIAQQNVALPLAHQPVQISNDDKVILRDCSTYDDMVAKNIQLQKQTYDEMNMTYYPFLKRMASIFYKNRTAITLEQSTDLFDTLQVDKYLARPFPANFTSDDYKNLQHLYSWYYNFVHTKDLSKMINTYKFQKLISVFDLRTKLPKTYPIKMTIMSGHDSDMIPLQTDLNISSAQCVQQLYRKGSTDALNCKNYAGYCSNVQIQLYSDDQISFYVMIRVQGQYVNLCGQKKTKCDYADFKARIKKLMITNVEELCGKTAPNQQFRTIIDQKMAMASE